MLPNLITASRRIVPHIERRGPNECWPWKGALISHRYAQIRIDGKSYPVAWLVYSVATGTDSGNLLVVHICDNTLCCNPAHLRAVTPSESIVDTRRSPRGAYGPANARTVRSWEQVQAIRAAYAAGGQTMADIGKRFGVSTSMVSNYVNRTIRRFA
jgi:hypothetical protein